MKLLKLFVFIFSAQFITTISNAFCPGLVISEGVKIKCKSPDGADTNCTENAMTGTKATFSCLPYYENEGESLTITCRPSGNWFPYRGFECNIDCGRQDQTSQPLIAHGYESSTLKWPWHAAIFREDKTNKDPNIKFEYICGGALISSSTVLTAAHCVASSSSKPFSPDSFRIVLGSISSDYNENILPNSRAKVFIVNALEYHADYNPWTFEADIAILQLPHRIEFDNNVRPVCYPRGENSRLLSKQLITGNTGFVVGYGLDEHREVSKFLKETRLPIVTTDDCTDSTGRVHSHSQYCAGYTNGTAVCSGDSGGGMYFAGTRRFIVQGVVSHARRGKCDSYGVFTRILNFAEWVEKGEAKFSASIPQNKVSQVATVNQENKFCPDLKPPLNGQVECYQNSSLQTKIECNQSKGNAVAKLICDQDYMKKLKGGSSEPSADSQFFASCLAEGRWETMDMQCEPECGRITMSKSVEDQRLAGDAFPWHAKIYGVRRSGASKPKLIQMCSGSLIEKSFVLTAASCVTSDTGSLLPIRHFKVVLGTNSSNHLTDFKSPHIQIFDIKKIWIPQTFIKSEKIADVSVVQLESSAKLTNYVKRVCFLGEYPEDIAFGTWGNSPNFLKTIESKEFESARHSFTFSNAECHLADMKVPPRTFCSPVQHGEIVCKNDTGHGMVFSQKQNSELYVLKGVMSHVGSMPSDPRPCLVASYVAYTQVEAFGAWILDMINSAKDSVVSS